MILHILRSPNNVSIPNLIKLSTVNGGWGEYRGWSECTRKCGGGMRSRVRVCDNPAPANGGAACKGVAMETETCNKQPCDGKFIKFSCEKKNWG